MDKIFDLARELGYEGQELRDFIERQQDRDFEKFKIEAEREIAMKKLELESLSQSGGPKGAESNARFPMLKCTIF